MLTEYRGEPVAGGTFPAQIWHDFALASIQADKLRLERQCASEQEKLEQRALKAGDDAPDTPPPPPASCIRAGVAKDPDAVAPTTAVPQTATPGDGTSTAPAGGGDGDGDAPAAEPGDGAGAPAPDPVAPPVPPAAQAPAPAPETPTPEGPDTSGGAAPTP